MGSLVREEKHTGAAGENGMVAARVWHIIKAYPLEYTTLGAYATSAKYLVQSSKAEELVGIVLWHNRAEV
jgi:hypothetical protein